MSRTEEELYKDDEFTVITAEDVENIITDTEELSLKTLHRLSNYSTMHCYDYIGHDWIDQKGQKGQKTELDFIPSNRLTAAQAITFPTQAYFKTVSDESEGFKTIAFSNRDTFLDPSDLNDEFGELFDKLTSQSTTDDNVIVMPIVDKSREEHVALTIIDTESHQIIYIDSKNLPFMRKRVEKKFREHEAFREYKKFSSIFTDRQSWADEVSCGYHVITLCEIVLELLEENNADIKAINRGTLLEKFKKLKHSSVDHARITIARTLNTLLHTRGLISEQLNNIYALENLSDTDLKTIQQISYAQWSSCEGFDEELYSKVYDAKADDDQHKKMAFSDPEALLLKKQLFDMDHTKLSRKVVTYNTDKINYQNVESELINLQDYWITASNIFSYSLSKTFSGNHWAINIVSSIPKFFCEFLPQVVEHGSQLLRYKLMTSSRNNFLTRFFISTSLAVLFCVNKAAHYTRVLLLRPLSSPIKSFNAARQWRNQKKNRRGLAGIAGNIIGSAAVIGSAAITILGWSAIILGSLGTAIPAVAAALGVSATATTAAATTAGTAIATTTGTIVTASVIGGSAIVGYAGYAGYHRYQPLKIKKQSQTIITDDNSRRPNTGFDDDRFITVTVSGEMLRGARKKLKQTQKPEETESEEPYEEPRKAVMPPQNDILFHKNPSILLAPRSSELETVLEEASPDTETKTTGDGFTTPTNDGIVV